MEPLDERINPYTYTWTGSGTFSWWDTAANWSSSDGGTTFPNGASDTAKFDTYTDGRKIPVIDSYQGTNSITVGNLIVTANWNEYVGVDGTLTRTRVPSTAPGVGDSTGSGF